MFLNRFSQPNPPASNPPRGQPSPPPGNRSSSLSHRPNHLAPSSGPQRAVFSPRSSSLSLASNDSTTSLLASRRPNGSGLRQSSSAPETADPLRVLDAILGTGGPLTPRSKQRTNGTKPQEDEDGELDFEGLSLREVIESIADSEDEHVHRAQTMEDYEQDLTKFNDLHKSIHACDEILSSVEINLTNFQNDLAQVSAEIETLQARSTALGTRLENRKLVENGLGPIVEEISVSPAVVTKIVEGAIDEAWVRALAEVEKRSKAMDAKSKEQRQIKGINDLKPMLDNLVTMALTRIRDFLVAQVKALRSPNINAQIIQQQHFVRYKDLYAFLHRHYPKLAEEIAQAYMNTMRWYYLHHFTRYERALQKTKLHTLDKNDVLGADDGTRKTSILSVSNISSKSTGPPHDAFNLGRRIDLLKSLDQTALPSFLAEDDQTTHYLEYPFRQFNLALVDNASAEYSFLTYFFGPSLSYSQISKHFNHIFEPTFALGQTLTKNLVHETYDCLGLLLCVRLNQHFAFELQRRKIPAVDGYINATNMLLWPRFQLVMDAHSTSLRTATSSLPAPKSRPSAADLAKQSAAPHFTTQQFAQFLSGILALSTEAGDDEPVSTSLMRLRSEVEAFLTKVGRGMGDERKRERFWYNNYSLVLTIVGDTEGKLAAEQRVHFEGLKKAFEGPP